MIERIAVLQHIPRLSSSLPVSITLSEDDLRYVLEDRRRLDKGVAKEEVIADDLKPPLPTPTKNSHSETT